MAAGSHMNRRTRAGRVINIKDVIPARVAGPHRPAGAARVGRWAPATSAGVTKSTLNRLEHAPEEGCAWRWCMSHKRWATQPARKIAPVKCVTIYAGWYLAARTMNRRTCAGRVINIKDVIPARVAGIHRPAGAARVGRWAPATSAGVTKSTLNRLEHAPEEGCAGRWCMSHKRWATQPAQNRFGEVRHYLCGLVSYRPNYESAHARWSSDQHQRCHTGTCCRYPSSRRRGTCRTMGPGDERRGDAELIPARINSDPFRGSRRLTWAGAACGAMLAIGHWAQRPDRPPGPTPEGRALVAASCVEHRLWSMDYGTTSASLATKIAPVKRIKFYAGWSKSFGFALLYVWPRPYGNIAP